LGGGRIAEQTRIVAEVERRLSVVEELEAVVSANLQRATRLRQSILQKAFIGKTCRPRNASGRCGKVPASFRSERIANRLRMQRAKSES